MYKCPNCGGDLEYIPGKDYIVCPYCDTKLFIEPDEKTVGEENEFKEGTTETYADEHRTMQGTVYTCSQCGAELFVTDDTAVTFCSYCGSQTMLKSVMEMEAPDVIVPFKVSKDLCEDIYKRRVKKNIFAQSRFRKPSTIEQFRGIYMPFWIYTASSSFHDHCIKASMKTPGVLKNCYDDYDVEFSMETSFCNYKDASVSLPDDISNAIQPMDFTKGYPFISGLTAGFYVDRGDIPAEIYDETAINEMAAECDTFINNCLSAKNYGGTTYDNSARHLTLEPEVKRGYFPLWFLSVKNKDGTMSYAVINGVTGSCHVDMPISIGKFLALSAAIALPVILFLTMFTMTPQLTLIISLAMVLIGMYLLLKPVKESYMHSSRLDDGGYLYSIGQRQPDTKVHLKSIKVGNQIISIISIIIYVLGGAYLLISLFSGYLSETKFYRLMCVSLVVFLASFTMGAKNRREKVVAAEPQVPGRVIFLAQLPLLLCMAAGIACLIINPVADIWYYASCILNMAALAYAVIKTVVTRNRGAIRKPSQLGKRGHR